MCSMELRLQNRLGTSNLKCHTKRLSRLLTEKCSHNLELEKENKNICKCIHKGHENYIPTVLTTFGSHIQHINRHICAIFLRSFTKDWSLWPTDLMASSITHIQTAKTSFLLYCLDQGTAEYAYTTTWVAGSWQIITRCYMREGRYNSHTKWLMGQVSAWYTHGEGANTYNQCGVEKELYNKRQDKQTFIWLLSGGRRKWVTLLRQGKRTLWFTVALSTY